ncbi:MAG: thiamine pyrophosphate-binding protein, partial [Bacteriovorax sp.]
MNVTDFIAHFFSDERINHVFGVSGANIEDLMSELARINQTKVILAKSEYNAATMALGSYLASKEVGVVLTTSGPGILNTLPVLAEAFASKIPFVLISGIVPEGLEGMGAFQDTSGKGESFNILDMLAPCTSFLFKAHNEQEIPEALYKAFQICRIQKKPAVLLIPKNLFNKEINKEVLKSLIFDEVKFPDTTNAALFCEEFSSADKRPPLVVLGEELIHVKDLTPVLDFIDKSAGMVALTPNAKGLFDHRHPQFLGLTGVMGHDEVNNYLKKTEHVVFIGTGFDLLSRFGMESDLSQKHLLLVKEE